MTTHKRRTSYWSQGLHFGRHLTIRTFSGSRYCYCPTLHTGHRGARAGPGYRAGSMQSLYVPQLWQLSLSHPQPRAMTQHGLCWQITNRKGLRMCRGSLTKGLTKQLKLWVMPLRMHCLESCGLRLPPGLQLFLPWRPQSADISFIHGPVSNLYIS